MKIVQITAVTEYQEDPLGKMIPFADATVYGLGDDNKVYYYTTNGWKEYGTE